MSKLDKFKLKVFWTTQTHKVGMKIKDKYKKARRIQKANRVIYKANFRAFKGDVAQLGYKIRAIGHVETGKFYKVGVFTTTRRARRQFRKYEKLEFRGVYSKANFYIRWRAFSTWYHKVFYKLENTHIDFDEATLGKTWSKIKGFVPKDKTKQAVVLLVSTLVIYFTFESTIFQENAVLVYADNQYIGAVEKEEHIEAEQIIEELLLEGNEEVGTAKLDEEPIKNMNIEFVPARVDKEELITVEEVVDTISETIVFNVEAYEVKIDGETVGYVQDKETYDKALEHYGQQFLPTETDGITNVVIQMENDVTLEKTTTYKYMLMTQEELEAKFAEPVVAEKTYTVVDGDTVWGIAVANGLTEDELLDINPSIVKTGAIYPGDTLNLVKKVPRVSVSVTYDKTYTDIAYRDVEEVPNDKQYRTYRKTISEGSDGESTYTIQVTKVNGVETARKTLNEEVLVAPVNKVVEVGTMNTPPKSSTGIFKQPASGRRTDNFGTRGGTHKGIDIAAPAGTPIYAADGGVVKLSGWSGNYGNLVIIDHENGFQTYYAHNSKLYVSQGERVYQGQLIAAMGTTGDSTGNHCHFEVRMNGVPVNPDNYLR